jgi:hypothetical protein
MSNEKTFVVCLHERLIGVRLKLFDIEYNFYLFGAALFQDIA